MPISESQKVLKYREEDVVCAFDSVTGNLLSIENSGGYRFTGSLAIDIGCDREYAAGSLAYLSFEGANTWDLPQIDPQLSSADSWAFIGFEKDNGTLTARYQLKRLELAVRYRIVRQTVEITAQFSNGHMETRHINGVAFIVRHTPENGSAVFEFPGNVPYSEFGFSDMQEGRVIQTRLVNPVIHINDGGNHVHLIFVDEEEKWGTGVYKSGADLTCVNLAAVEADLEPGLSLSCGVLYIQLTRESDPYRSIRDLYERKGWLPPVDGCRDGVLYSCHPYGTMDSDFPIRRDLFEYAEELNGLRDMGIDHVWILPIFEHLNRGVYHPTDQRIIDDRYGGDDAVRAFSRKIHELGMTLLFDYVPHGPAPEDDLGRNNMQWASVKHNGEPQLEWNCLSFDMTNPDYLQYTKDLVKEHVAKFDVDGARIDCAMGGLTNWRPWGGNRPSGSNLKGGISISKAIRDGFVESGKKPLVTPENFNPVPAYAPYTDVFYDMVLYRVLFDLECAGLAPEDYARELTRWLNTELLSTVKGYVKLRFLGNHDTVTWVWNKARATAYYGVDKAKALWVLMSCIDGMPMIYQGDEDASIYKGEMPDLRNFFKGLFKARKQYLGNDYETEYLFTGTPVIAFYRINITEARLVAINMSPDPSSFEPEGGTGRLEPIFGGADLENDRVALGGYGYVLFRIAQTSH